jgi:prolyl-tRNA synthetase
MYWSKLFIPTLREGERLLERAGYMRQLGSGSYLFLGRRSLGKIARIAREELESIGAQEMYVPDGAAMADLAGELRSYRQLPQIWYRAHTILDGCSFDASAEGLEERFAGMSQAFQRILRRCGVEFLIARSLAGEKLLALSEGGEDCVVRDGSGNAADLASAVSVPRPSAATDPDGDFDPEPFHTPGCKTIAEVVEFTGLDDTSHIKSLVMAAGEVPVLALLRGDHQMSAAKLKHILRAPDVRPANAEEIRRFFGASAGSLGPVGVSGVRILADEALRGRRNMIAGANKDDFHLRHVTPGEDFDVEYFDLRRVAEGDCSVHDGAPLRFERAMELAWGHRIGPCRSAEAPLLHVTDESGREVPMHCGTYGMAIERILWAAAERHRDQDGLRLPASITPVDVIVTPVNFAAEAQRKTAFEIMDAAQAAGLDVLLDDRDERPGVKFKDADLIGAPWRVTVGKKVEQGLVEIVERISKQRTDVPAGEAVVFLRERI